MRSDRELLKIDNDLAWSEFVPVLSMDRGDREIATILRITRSEREKARNRTREILQREGLSRAAEWTSVAETALGSLAEGVGPRAFSEMAMFVGRDLAYAKYAEPWYQWQTVLWHLVYRPPQDADEALARVRTRLEPLARGLLPEDRWNRSLDLDKVRPKSDWDLEIYRSFELNPLSWIASSLELKFYRAAMATLNVLSTSQELAALSEWARGRAAALRMSPRFLQEPEFPAIVVGGRSSRSTKGLKQRP
jgi:hypothetical protein